MVKLSVNVELAIHQLFTVIYAHQRKQAKMDIPLIYGIKISLLATLHPDIMEFTSLYNVFNTEKFITVMSANFLTRCLKFQ